MYFTRAGLLNADFIGFVPFSELPAEDVPVGPGVYMVFRSAAHKPDFLPSSGAGWFKNKDPSVTRAELEAAWVAGASVMYIGKAGAGLRGNRGLSKRLSEYRQHGAGAKTGHWGGRYIWQLADHGDALVAWKETPDEDPEDVETALIQDFVLRFGSRPFANRKNGRAAKP